MRRMKLVITIRNTVRATSPRSASSQIHLVDAHTGSASEGIDEVANDETTDETDDGSQRDSGCRLC